MSEITEKVCAECGKLKPISEFHKYNFDKAKSKDGYRAKCKDCRNAQERIGLARRRKERRVAGILAQRERMAQHMKKRLENDD